MSRSNPWRRLVDPATLQYFYVNKESNEKFWEENEEDLWIRKERPSECRYAFYENRLTSQRCFLDDPPDGKFSHPKRTIVRIGITNLESIAVG